MRHCTKNLLAAAVAAGPVLRSAGMALLVTVSPGLAPALVVIASPVLAPALARAADKPVLAPPASWVKPAGGLPVVPGGDGAAVRLILDDNQLNVTAAGTEFYVETAYRLDTPEGLAAGTVTFAWRPDTDTVTVHKLHIIRNGKVIDVLAAQQFTVLRRETNLERAALDGTLTATLQPEGLQVGDIVDLAMTIARSDPLFRGKPEWLLGLQLQMPVDESRLRVRWPQDLPVRWRTTDPVPAMVETRAGGVVELEANVKGLQPAVQPKFAPARFATRRQVELTAFGSWAELGALLAPLYAKAATISPGSPLAAEVDRIRAASSDPKVQAEAALRLVEDRIHYLFLGLGDGGMVPADAATTWSRRFGDCKGKTVLLLAFLHALGIAADPVAVNAGDGDGIDQRLPMISLFNHVVVRATVAGKTYWLDGTRIGDRKLEDIPPFAFKWGLPLVAEDATLVAIPLTPPTRPFGERAVTIDARGGLSTPAPFTAKLVMRGDSALLMKARMVNATPADRDRGLGEFWRGEYPDLTVKTVTSRYDEATGEYVATVDGTMKMDWSDGSYEADDVALGWKADFSRDEGPRKDAPYLVSFPRWDSFAETILLPDQGRGFTAGPADVAQTVAGIEYRRHAEIKDGKYVVTASSRAVAQEFAAADAPAAQKALRAMRDRRVFLNAPSTRRWLSNVPAKDPAVARSQAAEENGDHAGALDQANAAVAASPKNPDAYLAKATALVGLGRRDEAAATAAALDRELPDDSYAQRVAGSIYAGLGRQDEAMARFGRAIAIAPDGNGRAYFGRALSRPAGDRAGRRADLDTAIRQEGDWPPALYARAALAEEEGDLPGAIVLYDRLAVLAPQDGEALARRGIARMKRHEDALAQQDFAAARALATTADQLNALCWDKAVANVALDSALADCDAALAKAPKSMGILDSRGFVLLRLGRYADAITTYDRALGDGMLADSLYGRGIARLKSGDTATGQAEIAKAVSLDPAVAGRFRDYGMAP